MSSIIINIFIINVQHSTMLCELSYCKLFLYCFPEAQFKNVVHSLDVWHKSKSIKKCLAKVGVILIYNLNACQNICSCY